MPYILELQRPRFDKHIAPLAWEVDEPGELNYVLSCLVDDFIADHGFNYAAYNAAIGVLECAKLELYRRLVAPYEDEKRLENGDVFRYTEDTKERDPS